jgi:anion-transporting  ArsA/GET3 family ATPase
VRVRRIVDLFFDNRVMQTFIKAAPALKELAMLGKITSGIRAWGPELPYDVIVVDAFSTGHFQALLNAPRGMAELIQSGPMGEQSRNMVEVLGRNDLVQYKVVTLAEELPAAEAIEQVQQLKNSFQVTSEIILNRYYESPISTEEVASARQKDLNQSAAQFAEYLENLLRRQESQLNWLQQQNPIEKVLPWVLQSETQKVINTLQGRL